MKKALATLLILAPLAGQTQAALIFGGDFQLYKPGTGYTVTATLDPGAYGKTLGDNQTLTGGTVTYGDSTSGNTYDLPGWVGPYGGSNSGDYAEGGNGGPGGAGDTALNVFGTWSGGPGTMIQSAAPLTRPTLGAGEVYQISADIIGDAGPMRFDLTVNDVVIAPDTSSIPLGGTWDVMSNTYSSLPAGDVKIVMGTDPALGALVGTRGRIDNVRFDAVPEPASALLLGLGGLALLRRRRK